MAVGQLYPEEVVTYLRRSIGHTLTIHGESFVVREVSLSDDEYFVALCPKGVYWNGWECPLFPYAEANRVAAYTRERVTDDEQPYFVDDVMGDFVETDALGTFRETIEGQRIGGVTYYGLGSFGWCWTARADWDAR